jgi:hypothetical protein
MFHRLVVAASVLGTLAMLTGCGASAPAKPAVAAGAAEPVAASPELWVTHDETEMSIGGGKEHSVHHEEETALRPTLVTMRKARR